MNIEEYQDDKTVTFDNNKLVEEITVTEAVEEATKEVDENTTKLSDKEKVVLYKNDQTDRYKQIKKSIDISSKNKAILSLKSSDSSSIQN